MKDREIARILRIGLLLNYFTIGQVERWCEQRLLSLDGPKADPFIELYTSLHRGSAQTLSALSRFPGKTNDFAAVKSYFFGFYRSVYFNGCSMQSVEREIIRFYELDEVLFDEDEILMCEAMKEDSDVASDESQWGEVLSEFLLAYESFDELQDILDAQEIGRPSIPVRQIPSWLD